jgi:SAM-dependent methyltransferase
MRWNSVVADRGRRRASMSVGLRLPRLLRWIIRRSERTVLGPALNPQTGELGDSSGSFLAAKAEFEDGERFFAFFRGDLGPADLGRRVLDLGCGYGGRTVYYAERCASAAVVGLETTLPVVERCRAFAASRRCERVTFDVGVAEALPYDDGCFDAVVSFDVLEHVDDPLLALREVRRVLRPGGSAWLVFPTYLGARASHLDYVTRVPLLHRVFDPAVIVEVVNEVLEARGWPTSRQPPPRVSRLGHVALPGLNGLTLSEARAGVREAGLELESEWLWPCIRASDPVPGAAPAARALGRWQRVRDLPEVLIGSIAMRVTPA